MQHDDAEVRRKAIGGTPTEDNAETVPGTFPALTNRPTRRGPVRGKTPTPACDRIQGTDNQALYLLCLPSPTFPLYRRFFLAPLCADTTDFGRILGVFLSLSIVEDIEERFT
jgi:hypothetical protein